MKNTIGNLKGIALNLYIALNSMVILCVCTLSKLGLMLCNPMDCSLPGFSIHEILQARILEWVAISFSRDLPNPGIKPRSPALQVDSLPAEPQGKPKNTGVDSLYLCQWIFPTQESNRGLLHCRRILYQLSYQGSPNPTSNLVSL